jgi:hypothetical protein
MTPGYDLKRGLGGNVHGWPRAEVNAWRAAYVAERERTGVAGFAEFDFRFANASPVVMHDVLSALAAALSASRSAASPPRTRTTRGAR